MLRMTCNRAMSLVALQFIDAGFPVAKGKCLFLFCEESGDSFIHLFRFIINAIVRRKK